MMVQATVVSMCRIVTPSLPRTLGALSSSTANCGPTQALVFSYPGGDKAIESKTSAQLQVAAGLGKLQAQTSGSAFYVQEIGETLIVSF